MHWLTLLVVGVVFCALAQCAESPQKITSLPGWKGPLPFTMYSGYLDAGSPKNKMFYWFIESENDPANDPVVLWLNGGPGASSVEDGLLTENGPFMFNVSSLSDPNPQLLLRPFRWTRNASVIFWESPPGVGFSYCDPAPCPQWNDTSTAEVNHGFVCSFFKAFPHLAKNEFFLTGESYAGIYIPTLAYQIMTKNICPINLKGLAIGNGCNGNGWGTNCSPDMSRYSLHVLRDRTMVPDEMYHDVLNACYDWKYPDRIDWQNATQACKDATIAASNAAGKYNIYNVYDTCPSDRMTFLMQVCGGGAYPWACKQLTEEEFQISKLHSRLHQKHFDGYGDGSEMPVSADNKAAAPPNNGATGCLRCTGHLPKVWLQQDSAMKALHAHAKWGTQKFSYDGNLQSTLPMVKALATKYRIWFYSGDADTEVPYPGTMKFLEKLGYPIKKRWQPWHLTSVGNPVAGFTIEYDAPIQFRWLTIKDAGHLVPHYTPLAGYEMYMHFLKNEPLA